MCRCRNIYLAAPNSLVVASKLFVTPWKLVLVPVKLIVSPNFICHCLNFLCYWVPFFYCLTILVMPECHYYVNDLWWHPQQGNWSFKWHGVRNKFLVSAESTPKTAPNGIPLPKLKKHILCPAHVIFYFFKLLYVLMTVFIFYSPTS